MDTHTIVLGYDGSPDAHRALLVAADLVADSGVVHVVTAYDLAEAERTLASIRANLPDEYQSSLDLLSGARTHLAEAVSFLDHKGIAHVTHLVEGHAAGAILDVADEVRAGLVIVGNRGYGRVERFLRGSVSARIAGHAKTSFLVVHDDPA